jgi:hypothetical protein
MALPVNSILDFGNARRITNLAPAAAAGEAVVYEQLQSAIEGLSWKDDARVASTVDITLASPGTTVDGVTLASGDRVLVKDQTDLTENGIYIWNGSAVPMTRAPDADDFAELDSAVITVTEGTAGAGTTWRQTQVGGTLGTDDVIWTAFGTSAPAASETVSGIAEIATQAETDAGTDDARFVTPLKLATYAGKAKRYAVSIGDGSSTSLVVTHNLGTLDVQVYAYENAGSKREVFVEKQHTSTNSVTLVFDTAPTSNAIRVVVLA